MRFLRSLIATAGLALVCALAVAAQADDTPELNVVGTFPDNPFSRECQRPVGAAL